MLDSPKSTHVFLQYQENVLKLFLKLLAADPSSVATLRRVDVRRIKAPKKSGMRNELGCVFSSSPLRGEEAAFSSATVHLQALISHDLSSDL